jgi:tRNA threonylcarbamoyladenosine modification (KEOPS) complex Cgi121 subunit
MIENSQHLRPLMDGFDFPHFSWNSSSPVEAGVFTKTFLKHRPTEHWVLVGQGIAQCHMQLWTAWNSAARRQQRGTSLARSFDAEFLRYMAGTHHVSEAFKRAGVRDGDRTGCFILLPSLSKEGEMPVMPSSREVEQFERQALQLASSMDVNIVDAELQCNTEGSKRLGIQVGEDTVVTCDLLIGHVLTSEFNS